MRYIKVFLLAVFFFLALVFFFQNQGALSQNMVLTLNLFFIPSMSSIPLPFYFLIILAFACGALLTLAFLVWDKVNMSARLMKKKWHISSLERELKKSRKKLEENAARSGFLRKAATGEQQSQPLGGQGKAADGKSITEDALAPDPDKP